MESAIELDSNCLHTHRNQSTQYTRVFNLVLGFKKMKIISIVTSLPVSNNLFQKLHRSCGREKLWLRVNIGKWEFLVSISLFPVQLTGPEERLCISSSWCRRFKWNYNNRREEKSAAPPKITEHVFCFLDTLLPRFSYLVTQESIYILARGCEGLSKPASKEALE